MALFYHLHKQLDLENNLVHELSEAEIIRIEKKLRAEVKLASSIDLNEVDQILNILRNHLSELKLLTHPGFRGLRQILLEENGFVVSDLKQSPNFETDDRFRTFIQIYFGTELKEYAGRCIQQNHFNALSFLLLFKECLPADLTDTIATNCLTRIDYATESIKIVSNGLEERITAVLNPHFFRCLNQLGAISFEGAMIDLYNSAIQTLRRHEEKLFWRLAFAVGFYKPVNSELHTTFVALQKRASLSGVRERVYSSFEANQKGGTYFASDATIPIDEAGKKEGQTDSFRTIGVVITFIVLLIVIVRVFLASAPNGSRNNGATDPANLRLDNEQIIYEQLLEDSLNATEFYLHSENLEVIETDSVAFEVGNSRYMEVDVVTYSNASIDFVNNTSQPLVLLFGHYKTLFLQVNETKRIHGGYRRFSVYTGSSAELIVYKDSTGEQRTDFRFFEPTEQDLQTLQRIYTIENANLLNGYKVTLSEVNSELKIDLEMLFNFGDVSF